MRLNVIQQIEDVTASQLCCGCGACAWASPDTLEMIDDKSHGRRPIRRGDSGDASDASTAMDVCPGYRLEHDQEPPNIVEALRPGWGPVLEVWEGWATDEALRWNGSSGGGTSAVAWACVQAMNYHGVLHIAQRQDIPILNETVMSTSLDQLRSRAGSRYAPASPCDRLDLIENADGPCVMIGKPCDIAAAQRARRHSAKLDANLGLTLGIFCAGTPNLEATAKLLKRLGIDDWREMQTLRYRGEGWPGEMKATTQSDSETDAITYAEGWGEILQKHRQWRCYICPDHTGEFADIAIGDPWYRRIDPGEPGSSLFVIRTERGKAAFEAALSAGLIEASKCEPDLLPKSQPNLLNTRGAMAGRLLALRLAGAAVPRYAGFVLWRFWFSKLSFKQKLQSIAGTMRRIKRKGLTRRRTMQAWTPDQPILDSTAKDARS